MPELCLTPILNHKTYKQCALILCFVLTATTGCSQASGDKNYFPLATSAKWEYTGRSSLPGGKQFSFRATARVDGQTLINGKPYFKHITSSNLKGLEYVRYYRIGDDGIYFRLDNNPNGHEMLEMPLPIPIGTKWLSGSTEVQAERAGTITINGRGYRDCLKLTYRQQNVTRKLENYLAPDIGLIKAVDVNSTESESTVELTLEKYEP